MVDHEAAEAVVRLALLIDKEGGIVQPRRQVSNEPRRRVRSHVGQHTLWAPASRQDLFGHIKRTANRFSAFVSFWVVSDSWILDFRNL